MLHHPPRPEDAILSRRELLCRSGMGFGALALGSLMADVGLTGGPAYADGVSPAPVPAIGINPLRPNAPPLQARAKRVVHLFMNGGPSHVDTFDPKPVLGRHNGKPVPTKLPTERKTGAAMGSPFRFRKYGQSGIEVSDLFAHTAEMIDEVCVIRSMHADVPNHEPSLMLMNCGDARQARPCMGSWVLYGLGTENQNLPGFIVMCPGGFPIAESQNWQSAFLPGIFQGTYIDSSHTEIEKLIAHVRNHSVGPAPSARSSTCSPSSTAVTSTSRPGEAELEARIQSFELAYRMQSEAADAFDISREPESIRALYGPGVHARQLLIARRLLERGRGFSSSGMAMVSRGTTTTIWKRGTARWPGSATAPSRRSSRTSSSAGCWKTRW